MMLWKIVYNVFFVPLGWLAIRLYALVNHKAKHWLDGRVDLFERVRSQVALLPPESTRIWFHSSSLGEFEQAKPIIAELKAKYPAVDIIVTFFSPSGYEHSQT